MDFYEFGSFLVFDYRWQRRTCRISFVLCRIFRGEYPRIVAYSIYFFGVLEKKMAVGCSSNFGRDVLGLDYVWFGILFWNSDVHVHGAALDGQEEATCISLNGIGFYKA